MANFKPCGEFHVSYFSYCICLWGGGGGGGGGLQMVVKIREGNGYLGRFQNNL